MIPPQISADRKLPDSLFCHRVGARRFIKSVLRTVLSRLAYRENVNVRELLVSSRGKSNYEALRGMFSDNHHNLFIY